MSNYTFCDHFKWLLYRGISSGLIVRGISILHQSCGGKELAVSYRKEIAHKCANLKKSPKCANLSILKHNKQSEDWLSSRTWPGIAEIAPVWPFWLRESVSKETLTLKLSSSSSQTGSNGSRLGGGCHPHFEVWIAQERFRDGKIYRDTHIIGACLMDPSFFKRNCFSGFVYQWK